MAKIFANTGVTTGLAADRAAMTSPFAGQYFYETDTKKIYVYSGSSWVETSNINNPGGMSSFAYTPPMVSVYKTAAQTIANATVVEITFDSEYFDTDAMHSTSTNTGRLTVNTAGVYLITLNLTFADNGTGQRLIYIRKNNSNVAVVHEQAGAGARRMSVSHIESAAVNDYFTAHAYEDSGLNWDVLETNATNGTMSKFSAAWLGKV